MDRIATLLPSGPPDEFTHHGARRRSARYPVHASVRVVSGERARGVVLNASAGGLRVAVDRAIAEGDTVDLEIRFPHGRRSTERAKVVWRRELRDGFVLGLAFAA